MKITKEQLQNILEEIAFIKIINKGDYGIEVKYSIRSRDLPEEIEIK